MREHGIRGYTKSRRARTTIPEPSGQKVPDLLKRDFTAGAPGRRYVGDITYLPLADGTNLYLATVIDCYSRRLVGWAVADHMRTSLVQDALKAGAATRGGLTGADLPLRTRVGLHLQGLRHALRTARCHPVHRRGRHERGQRARRVVQRDAEKGGPPRRRLLARRGHLPPRSVPLARPRQHPPPTLLVRLPVPVHLRGPLGRYAANRCVINPRVHVPGEGPGTSAPATRGTVKAVNVKAATVHSARECIAAHHFSCREIHPGETADASEPATFVGRPVGFDAPLPAWSTRPRGSLHLSPDRSRVRRQRSPLMRRTSSERRCRRSPLTPAGSRP